MTLSELSGGVSSAANALSSLSGLSGGMSPAPVNTNPAPGSGASRDVSGVFSTGGMTLGSFVLIYLILRITGLLPRWARII